MGGWALFANSGHGLAAAWLPALSQGALSGPLAALPPDIARPLVGVDPEYLDATFAQIRQDHGTVEVYLQRELGVGPLQLAALRKRLLD